MGRQSDRCNRRPTPKNFGDRKPLNPAVILSPHSSRTASNSLFTRYTFVLVLRSQLHNWYSVRIDAIAAMFAVCLCSKVFPWSFCWASCTQTIGLSRHKPSQQRDASGPGLRHDPGIVLINQHSCFYPGLRLVTFGPMARSYPRYVDEARLTIRICCTSNTY